MNKHKKIVQVSVISAYKLTNNQLTSLVNKLENKYKCNVKIDTRIDSSLIGGIKIIVGDTVIDGSIDFHLKRLHTQLLNV
jgi:F-type H+-transporting ATPase subunit delta